MHQMIHMFRMKITKKILKINIKDNRKIIFGFPIINEEI